MKSPLLKRAISGLVFVIIMVESIVASRVSFVGIWMLVAALCMWELLTLVRKSGTKPDRFPTILAGIALVLTTALREEKGEAWGVIFLLMLIMVFLVQLFDKSEDTFSRLAYSSLAILYVALPLALLVTLDPILVLCYITVVWANDTGAYLVGVAIGKHKMAPAISPKKSWEGFFGGILFAIGVSLVWYSLYWSKQGSGMEEAFGPQVLLDPVIVKLKWLGFGVITAVSAVAGDLLESKFKRWAGVKDSGKLIPGHGGVLDRFDAVLVSAPVVWCYVILIDILAVA